MSEKIEMASLLKVSRGREQNGNSFSWESFSPLFCFYTILSSKEYRHQRRIRRTEENRTKTLVRHSLAEPSFGILLPSQTPTSSFSRSFIPFFTSSIIIRISIILQYTFITRRDLIDQKESAAAPDVPWAAPTFGNNIFLLLMLSQPLSTCLSSFLFRSYFGSTEPSAAWNSLSWFQWNDSLDVIFSRFFLFSRAPLHCLNSSLLQGTPWSSWCERNFFFSSKQKCHLILDFKLPEKSLIDIPFASSFSRLIIIKRKKCSLKIIIISTIIMILIWSVIHTASFIIFDLLTSHFLSENPQLK